MSGLKVDAFSSLSHYSDHIRPIWETLPSVRGGWWTPANLPRSERLTIVASHRDAQTIGRPYVYVEHGAGQSYTGITNGSYSGGEGHDRCVLFLCPSERVAMRWRERYDVPAIAVGCSRLDWLYGKTRTAAHSGVGTVLDEGGDWRSRGLLAVHGSEVQGLRVGPGASEVDARSSGRLDADVRRAHPPDSRPHLPQRVGLSRRTILSPSSLLQSEASGIGQHGGEHSPVTEHSTRNQRQTDGVQPGASVLAGEHLVRQEGPASLPGMCETSAAGVLLPAPRPHLGGTTSEVPGRPTVAVSFHWDCALLPETRSAWRYYDPHLPRLVRDPRFRVVGHGHPRLWPTIKRRWAELGVEQWPDVDRVLSEADLLVVDNSSVAYEAAALGIPVVLLNIPSYRRDVEHSGRFWTSPPGVQVDHPSELADAIACALTDPPAHRAIRARAVEWAYDGLVDGHASERAAAAILEVLNARV